MDRPTLFLSSTVHDFGDLRSALKDYLELRGCRVLASEFTDFKRPLDTHSYDACLRTIEQADLFVLFIGRRVGGWYDEPAKISITRAEYRHAYELASSGRIRLLCFVRSEVFDHRQSVRDLAKSLREDRSLTASQRQRIENHSSQAMDDAEAIISFIDEVTRNGETVAASRGLGTAPVANWIWPFTTFTQIRQAIDPLIAHGLTVSQAAGRKALEVQLVHLLQGVMPILDGSAVNPVNSVLKLHSEMPIAAGHITAPVDVHERTWSLLVSLLTYSARADANVEPLLGTLGSDLLLRYDPATGTFQSTGEYELLERVVAEARLLKNSSPVNLADLVRFGQGNKMDGMRHVPGHIMVAWMHRLLRWVDLIGNAQALASSLSGAPFHTPVRVPKSPIAGQEEALNRERPTAEQIRASISALAGHDACAVES